MGRSLFLFGKQVENSGDKLCFIFLEDVFYWVKVSSMGMVA